MKPSEAMQFIAGCYKSRKPKPILIGPPGCGKTQICYQLADEILKVPRYTFQSTLYDPVEIKGLPVFIREDKSDTRLNGEKRNGGMAQFIRFEDMPTGKEGLLIIDDLPHAATQTQNAFMRLLLEGVAGAWELDGIFPVATGNKAIHKAGAKDLQTAMANRFVFIELDVSYEDWRTWAIGHDIVPEIIAYIGTPYGRDWLMKFEADRQRNPTPRSWEFASDIIKICGADSVQYKKASGKEISHSILREALHGCIGDEATSKFLGWLKVYSKLPDLNKIIAGENLIPDDMDIMYAAVSGLISIAKNSLPPKKKSIYQRLVEYSCELPENYAELAVSLIKDLYKLEKELFQEEKIDITDWRKKFSSVIL